MPLQKVLEKMTFNEWLNEVEVYSTRKERLIEGLDTYVNDTEFVIKWLEAAYNVGYKAGFESAIVIPTFSNFHQPNPNSHIPLQRCSKCGLDLTKPMGYVCNDSQCPTFLRVTSMNFGTKSTEGYNG